MSGLEIILLLAIDDGVFPRGHRSNIFNKDFTSVGISIFAH